MMNNRGQKLARRIKMTQICPNTWTFMFRIVSPNIFSKIYEQKHPAVSFTVVIVRTAYVKQKHWIYLSHLHQINKTQLNLESLRVLWLSIYMNSWTFPKRLDYWYNPVRNLKELWSNKESLKELFFR